MKNILLSICILQMYMATIAQNKSKPASVSVEKNSLVFFVVGDWGRNGEYNQQEVANAMKAYAAKYSPQFIISTGDNFYRDGVASVNDPQWMFSFENVYKSADLQVNWYAVLGNHDYHGNPQAQIDYSKISRRWNMQSRYYTQLLTTKQGKTLRFIYIDTNPMVKKYHKESEKYSDLTLQDTAKQFKWIDSLLTNSKEDWKIVVGHHPVYSSSQKHGNTQELIEWLAPRMEKAGVQAYFCGHDHDLQHNKPAGTSVDYFLSGAGSEVRQNSEKADYTKFVQATPGFAMVVIYGQTFNMYFIDKNMKVVYAYTRFQ